MADECCGDDHDAERLIQLKACDYFNIKLGKSGGIFKALKMVKLAEAGQYSPAGWRHAGIKAGHDSLRSFFFMQPDDRTF